MKIHFAIEYFDVVPFMKQKQRRKTRKKETKTRNQKKANKKDKKEEKRTRTRERERDREREIEKGGGHKRLRRKKGRHSIINKKMPFSNGKTRFFLYKKTKKGKEQKNKQGGLGPSEVALWATSPDP